MGRQMNGNLNPIEIGKADGKLCHAVYLSDENRLVQQVEPEEKIQSEVKMINMGCLEWTDSVTVQKSLSSEGLFSQESFIKLPNLKPGQEGNIKFKFLVKSESKTIALKAVEMKEFGKNPEVEMKGIGISAKSQEMVEMSSNKQTEKFLSSNNKEIITITDSNHNSFEEPKDSVEDDFDLLASEVNTLTLDTETLSSENIKDEDGDDDFEVIPVPACFNLDVPFEIVDEDTSDLISSAGKSEVLTSEETFKNILKRVSLSPIILLKL